VTSMLIRSATLALACGVTACVSLAPGAADVRVTSETSEVAECSSVGKIRVPVDINRQVDLATASSRFRNQVVTLGGNTGLVTDGSVRIPIEGTAYRCP
jgi:hypothetical protein